MARPGAWRFAALRPHVDSNRLRADHRRRVDERRAHTRLLACIPAYLESKRDEQDLALIRDVSVSGARLLTRTKLPAGVPIHLALYMGAEGTAPKLANGRVVR